MLSSELLVLDQLSRSDFDLFLEIYTNEKVMKDIGPVLSKERVINLFEQIIAENDKNNFFVVRNKRNKVAYGIIGLMKKSTLQFELGVMVLNEYKSKGYAYKATSMLLEHAFQNLNVHSVYVMCHRLNTGANRIAKALGFIESNMSHKKELLKENIKWELTFEQYKKT